MERTTPSGGTIDATAAATSVYFDSPCAARNAPRDDGLHQSRRARGDQHERRDDARAIGADECCAGGRGTQGEQRPRRQQEPQVPPLIEDGVRKVLRPRDDDDGEKQRGGATFVARRLAARSSSGGRPDAPHQDDESRQSGDGENRLGGDQPGAVAADVRPDVLPPEQPPEAFVARRRGRSVQRPVDQRDGDDRRAGPRR